DLEPATIGRGDHPDVLLAVEVRLLDPLQRATLDDQPPGRVEVVDVVVEDRRRPVARVGLVTGAALRVLACKRVDDAVRGQRTHNGYLAGVHAVVLPGLHLGRDGHHRGILAVTVHPQLHGVADRLHVARLGDRAAA